MRNLYRHGRRGPGLVDWCRHSATLWQSFTIADGVPSRISAIRQDRHGHLWLGTGWLKSGSEWGTFREDLYFRLRGFTLHIIPYNKPVRPSGQAEPEAGAAAKAAPRQARGHIAQRGRFTHTQTA